MKAKSLKKKLKVLITMGHHRAPLKNFPKLQILWILNLSVSKCFF